MEKDGANLGKSGEKGSIERAGRMLSLPIVEWFLDDSRGEVELVKVFPIVPKPRIEWPYPYNAKTLGDVVRYWINEKGIV